MSTQALSGNATDLIAKVTPEAREALAQVFIGAGGEPGSFDDDITRLVRNIAVFVVRAHERPADAKLFSQIVKAATASRAEVASLAARLSSLIELDPELVDETLPFLSDRSGRVGVHIQTLKQLDENLIEIADEFRKREGRPFAPMAVFLVACEIWQTRFNHAPTYSNGFDKGPPLYETIVRIARDMDARAAPAFALSAFRRARRRVAEHASKTNAETS